MSISREKTESLRCAFIDTYWWEGRPITPRLLDIDVPVNGVLVGPATVHAELLFLASQEEGAGQEEPVCLHRRPHGSMINHRGLVITAFRLSVQVG